MKAGLTMKTMHVLTGWSVLLLGLSFNPNILAHDTKGAPTECRDGTCKNPDTDKAGENKGAPADTGTAGANKGGAGSGNISKSRETVSEADVQKSKDALIDEVNRVSGEIAKCKDGGVKDFQTFLSAIRLYLLRDVQSPITDNVQINIKQYNLLMDLVLKERVKKAKDKKPDVEKGFEDLKKKFSDFSTKIGIKIEEKDRTELKIDDYPIISGAFTKIKDDDEVCVIKAKDNTLPQGGGSAGQVVPPVGGAPGGGSPPGTIPPKPGPTNEEIQKILEEFQRALATQAAALNTKLDQITQKINEPKKDATEPVPHKEDRSKDDDLMSKLLPHLLGDQGKDSPAPSTGGGGSAPPMPQSQPPLQNDRPQQPPLDPATLAAMLGQGAGGGNPMAALLPALLSGGGMFGNGNATPTSTTGSGIEVGSRFNPETMDLRRNLDDLNSKFAQTNARLNDVARNSTPPPPFGPGQPPWDPRLANFGGQPMGQPNYGNAPWGYPGGRNPRTVLASSDWPNRPPFGTFGSRASKSLGGFSATSGPQGSGFTSRRPDGRVTDGLQNAIRRNSSRWTQNVS